MSAVAPQKSLLVNGYEVVIGFETHTQLSTHASQRGGHGLARHLARDEQRCG